MELFFSPVEEEGMVKKKWRNTIKNENPRLSKEYDRAQKRCQHECQKTVLRNIIIFCFLYSSPLWPTDLFCLDGLDC